MARFIQAEYPQQHAGITRVARGLEVLASLNATHVVLHGLAFIGSPVTRAAAKVRAKLESLAAVRAQRRADDKLWKLALTDARIMADLSRAMSRDAQRDLRGYL
ncbi:MAG TPA: hypothetical protein VF522_20450 [Ramlibacter sp.]|uniref:hypothetical protein n=1 Tax=Ramlibacter sp. TaxID=1917967 RepID=UPI002ED3C76A